MPYEQCPGSLLAALDDCTCPMDDNSFGAGLALEKAGAIGSIQTPPLTALV